MTSAFIPYYRPHPHDKTLNHEEFNHGTEWSHDDEQVLKNLFASNTDPAIIAANMGRTVNGVLTKLVHMKLIRWSVGYRAYFRTPQL